MTAESLFKLALAGDFGGRLITGTTEVTGGWDALVCNTDTVFDELKVDGVDVVTARGYAGQTISAGMLIGAGFAQNKQFVKAKITAVKLTSGSVMAY